MAYGEALAAPSGDGTIPDAKPDLAARERLKMAVAAIVGTLEMEARKRVSSRSTIEGRWLEDMQQFAGEYDDRTIKELGGAGKSSLFINKTRPKTNSCEARLGDMLFPTDDKNWAIRPTPVPELTQGAKQAIARAHGMAAKATQAAQQGDTQAADAAVAEGEALGGAALEASEVMKAAQQAAEGMEAEIADQLVECRYNIISRDMIRQACQIGTGILKGPVLSGRSRKMWQRVPDQTGNASMAMVNSPDPAPGFQFVDAWGLFPNPNARTIDDSPDNFERHLMTPSQVRALAKQPGFDPVAVRAVLKNEPRDGAPTYLSTLRSISGTNGSLTEPYYHVWEYNGPLMQRDLQTICDCMGKDAISGLYQDLDPLDEVSVVIWFSQSEVLKFGIHPLDSCETLYTIYTLERDPASIWGKGIPRLMDHTQRAMNAAWRTMMDNCGLSSGPQIEIDPSVIEPVDNIWTLLARKLWKRRPDAPPGKPGLIMHDIPSHQAELANVIMLARELIDEETAMPQIAQGDEGPKPQQTAHGMSLLMNAANIDIRRMVKNFDDQVTVPNIRRMYDWNMQFSDKEDIKGDFTIDARGSSVLMLREIQAQNLMVFATAFAPSPIFGRYVKKLPTIEASVKANLLSKEEILYTEEEADANDAKTAGQIPPEVQVEQMKHQNALEIAALEHKNRMEELGVARETEMLGVAAKMNLTLDQLRAKMHEGGEERSHKERMFAAEAALAPASEPARNAA